MAGRDADLLGAPAEPSQLVAPSRRVGLQPTRGLLLLGEAMRPSGDSMSVGQVLRRPVPGVGLAASPRRRRRAASPSGPAYYLRSPGLPQGSEEMRPGAPVCTRWSKESTRCRVEEINALPLTERSFWPIWPVCV